MLEIKLINGLDSIKLLTTFGVNQANVGLVMLQKPKSGHWEIRDQNSY
jgi:hypothetical protein